MNRKIYICNKLNNKNMTHKFIILLFFISITSLFLSSSVFAIANPASTYCIEQGYQLEIKTDPSSGGQYGVCIFPDGKECEEWKFFRGECGVEYKKELPCKKAGEEIKTGQCCEDLITIKNDDPGPYEGCTGRVGGWAICSDCGNKICESWENTCNCPSDCTTIKEENYNNITYYILGIIGLIIFIFITYFLLFKRRKK